MCEYQTKDICYDGCHPEIAKQLKQGKAVLCRVWDSNGPDRDKEWIVGYQHGAPYPYISEGTTYKHAEPIPKKKTETRVKSRAEILKWFGNNCGYIEGEGHIRTDKVGVPNRFNIRMFAGCGESPDMRFNYRREWLEEVEVDE